MTRPFSGLSTRKTLANQYFIQFLKSDSLRIIDDSLQQLFKLRHLNISFPHLTIPQVVSNINVKHNTKAGTDNRKRKSVPAFQLVVAMFYLSSCSTDCGNWLAWAIIAVAACDRILYLVNSIICFAMSTSRMRDSAATRFS